MITYHQASDTFYYASLGSVSPRVNASTDGCQNWVAAVSVTANTANTSLADKPWIAVDNTGGATDGNLYLCWTRFYTTGNGPSEIRAIRSTDGGTTWINEQVIAVGGTSPFGCNIQVSSDASVNVVWAERSTDDIRFLRSTDAGQNYASPQKVNSGALRHPGDDNVVACGGSNRPTLNGNIRQLHQAWMAIDTSGGPNDRNIYVVWASDPADLTDQADVFFSVSTDNGVSWSNMVQPGAGGGLTDQFEPDVAVADNGDVAVVWYDRRNDVANNLNIDVYTAFSSDGGGSFGGIVQVTDVSFGVPPLNPNFNPNVAQCYMGEYISVDASGGAFYYLWGDNRNTIFTAAFPGGRLDPDVYFDSFPGPSNVVPSVSVDPASGDEGAGIILSGTATDGDGDFLVFSWSVTPLVTDAGAACTLTNETTLSPTATCSDNGTYTMTLTVTGDAAGSVSDSNTLTVANVAPTVTATTPLTLLNVGDIFDVSADFSDPGWNDIYTGSIDWDIPGEIPEVVAPLVTTDGPPQDEGTISGSNVFDGACRYDVLITVDDDDGGSGSDSVLVIIVGDSTMIRSTGYWSHQYRGKGKTDFSDEELLCLLEIVEWGSLVFDEVTPANTIDEALDVLETKGKTPMVELLESQLLAALLNFANGSVAWDQLIDTDGDSVGDTAFSAVIANAESVRINPASTKDQLQEQKDLLEKINLGQA